MSDVVEMRPPSLAAIERTRKQLEELVALTPVLDWRGRRSRRCCRGARGST